MRSMMMSKRCKEMKKKNISTKWRMMKKGIPKTILESKIFDQNKVLFHISSAVRQEKCWTCCLPYFFYHFVLWHLSTLTWDLACSELTFVYCPFSKVHLTTTFLHPVLELPFISLPNFAFFSIVNSPTIEFIIVPLTFIL